MTNPPITSPANTSRRKDRATTLTIEVVFYFFLLYLFLYAADYLRDFRAEGNLIEKGSFFVFHTILLYMHEGGHFLFSFFGSTLHTLGGSFWEVMLPFLVFVFALRDKMRIALFPVYYTGISLMDVSLYIRDAPFRRLPLLGGDKNKGGHDWWNLLQQWDMMSLAETVAAVVYVLGFLVCIALLVPEST